MKPRIDFSKPIQTRAGLPVRLLCNDAKGAFPVVALTTFPDGTEAAEHYTAAGSCYNDAEFNIRDLANVPALARDVRFWLLLDAAGGTRVIFGQTPSYLQIKDCIACKEINVTIADGEGLGNE